MLAAADIVPEDVRSLDRNGLPALGLPISGLCDAAASPGRTCASEGKTSRVSLPVAAAPLSTLLALSGPDLPSLSPSARLSLPPAVSQVERLGLDQPSGKVFNLAAAMAAAARVPVQQPRVTVQLVAPVSNTGAQKPVEANSALFPVPLGDDTPAWVHDGFLIDWLRFVVVSPEEQARLLGQWRSEPGDWTEQDSGHMGYRKCYRNNGVTIYYDHMEEGRGICFDVSGKGCRWLESEGQIVRRFGWPSLLAVLTNTKGVHITRLDAAIDDKAGLVDMGVVKAAVETGAITSRFKSAYAICKRSLSDGRSFGTTVNFGSRVSDMMIRMYDKGAEQKQAGHWTRVEVEAKDENAQELARLLSVAAVPGEVVAGVLRNYLTFRDLSTATRKSRCRISSWWDTFLGHVDALRLAIAKVPLTMERALAWLDRQVAPTLALAYLGASSGKMLLADLVEDGRRRLRPRHFEALKAHKVRQARAVLADGRTGF